MTKSNTDFDSAYLAVSQFELLYDFNLFYQSSMSEYLSEWLAITGERSLPTFVEQKRLLGWVKSYQYEINALMEFFKQKPWGVSKHTNKHNLSPSLTRAHQLNNTQSYAKASILFLELLMIYLVNHVLDKGLDCYVHGLKELESTKKERDRYFLHTIRPSHYL